MSPAEGGWWPRTLGQAVAVSSPRGSSRDVKTGSWAACPAHPAGRASAVAASRELGLPSPGCGLEWAPAARVEALPPGVTDSGPPELRGCSREHCPAPRREAEARGGVLERTTARHMDPAQVGNQGGEGVRWECQPQGQDEGTSGRILCHAGRGSGARAQRVSTNRALSV
uniref:Uncharacterized protein n=1 Tax=Rousettus aegyptiacus TaxID=9407 RepID=A0A7J8JGV8_ROUAE|nr:hypothetical protein HJG63_010101 [Rousettus aegyptiacus]